MALRLSGLHYYTPVGLIRRVASHQAHFALPYEEPVPAVDQRGKHGKERRIFQRILKVLSRQHNMTGQRFQGRTMR
ncbi:hypothetical protein SDC9_198152 [bioreactor metagenome]|uniref:Uncharacterized protein n=1 Tax=bioreactor metagenome TaxID=1076179 RepID=A0A645IGX0_9ZZZZ